MNKLIRERGKEPTKGLRAGRWVSFITLVCVLAINGWQYFVSLQSKPELERLKEIQAIKVKQQNQLVAWGAESKVATRQFESDKQSLFSMYEQCQSLDDFFVVYPDMIVSSFQRIERGFELRFYVPHGNHRLKLAVGPELIQPNSEKEVGGVTQTYDLEGGRSYQITATVTDRRKQAPELHFQLSGFEKTKLPIKDVDLEGESIVNEKERLWLPVKAGDSALGEKANVDRARLLNYSWLMTGDSPRRSESLRLLLEFETKGILRWSAGDPEVLQTMLAIAKSESELEDKAESRRYDETDGAYYKKRLSQDKNLNTIDW